MNHKSVLITLALCTGLATYFLGSGTSSPTAPPPEPVRQPRLAQFQTTTQAFNTGPADALLGQAFQQRRSNFQITGALPVSRLLPDDNDGSRHQKFILQTAAGQTVLVAHNIDIAPRINALQVGDIIEFNGEYEWNEKGGVIHWTHHDPQNRHVHGWLRHRGATYQ